MSFFFLFYLFSFCLLRNQRTGGRNKSFLGRRTGTSGKEEVWGKGGRKANKVQKMCTHSCKCKNDTVKIVPTMGEREMKENGRGKEFMYNTLDTL
jgi:hypothetical protein